MSTKISLLSAINLHASHGSLARTQMPSHVRISTVNLGFSNMFNRGKHSAIIRHQVPRKLQVALGDLLPCASPHSSPDVPIWATWILGSLVYLVLPRWKLRGGFLQKLGSEVKRVADSVEDSAEIVQDIAETFHKVSSQVADNLPDDGILKEAALWVEKASKQVAEDARQTVDFMNKVNELEKEVGNDWETIVESHAQREAAKEECELGKQTRGHEDQC